MRRYILSLAPIVLGACSVLAATGHMPPAEPVSAQPRPPRELKGFMKVELAVGAEETVCFTLTRRSLSYYDGQTDAWVCEPGEYQVAIGSSSRDIRLTGTVQID